MDCSIPTSESPSPTAPLPNTTFDLENYICRYHAASETRLQRLLFIAKTTHNPDLSQQAYTLAESQIKSTGNITRYRETFDPESSPTPQNNIPHNIPYDPEWVNDQIHSSSSQIETLESRLSASQSSLNKEAMRTCYLSLAEFYKRRGELRDSMRYLIRTRDYCTTNHQIAKVCLLIIEGGLDTRNLPHTASYITKAEHSSDILLAFPDMEGRLSAASGLILLQEGRYAEASRKFLAANSAGTGEADFGAMMSAEDVAAYGALLALASADLRTVKREVLENSASQQRLELVPKIRDAVRFFARAEYGPCFDLLDEVRGDFVLDMYLAPHLEILYQKVLERCVITYFQPYRSVLLKSMRSALRFSSDINGEDPLETLLEKLILDGKISAKMDAQKGILYGYPKKTKADLSKHVFQMGNQFITKTENMILRMTCIEQDLVVVQDRVELGRAYHHQPFNRRNAGGPSNAPLDRYSSDEEIEIVSGDAYDGEEDAVMMDLDGV